MAVITTYKCSACGNSFQFIDQDNLVPHCVECGGVHTLVIEGRICFKEPSASVSLPLLAKTAFISMLLGGAIVWLWGLVWPQ